MQLPFGEWLPDQPDHLKKGANVATNVYYAQNSYKRFPSLVNYSSNTCVKDSRGAGSFRDNSNTVYNFVATKDTIYKLTSGTFTDVGTGGTLLSNSYATFTITVTDYANIATDSTLVLTKNDGTTVTFTCQGAGAGTPATDKFFHNESNDTTADNIYTCINAHADFVVANPAANVVTIREVAHKAGLLKLKSSDTTRLAVTSEGITVCESAASISGTLTEDELWVINKRTVNGTTKRFVEVFADFDFDETASTSFKFLDSHLSYSGSATTSLTGLSHLEGERVSILGDGATHADKTVSSGAITLDRSVTTACVGLPYNSVLQSMRLEGGAAEGTSQGKTKRISKVVLRLFETVGVKVGPSLTKLETIPFRTTTSLLSTPVDTLLAGDKEIEFDGDFESDGFIVIKQDQPLPCSILAIYPTLVTADG